MQNKSKSRNVSVFPNPVFSSLIVDLGKSYNEIEIKLLDDNGQILKKVNSKSKRVEQLDVKNINTGLYFITIQADDKFSFRKIVKE